MIRVELKRSHAGPVAAGHPWVYAQAVARTSGAPQDGDEVVVVDAFGKGLGRGLWAEGSAISVRLLTRDPEQALDAAFFAQRVDQAVSARRLMDLPRADTDGYRLIHAEGDGLAGFVADAYGDVLVLQLLTSGSARLVPLLVEALCAALAPRSVVALTSSRAQARASTTSSRAQARASTTSARAQADASTESPRAQADAEPALTRSCLFGEPAPALRFVERGLRFDLGPGALQKTGYYFDQREHRAEVERLAKGREVLDACCYVGGFALAAARGGARSVLALDSSQPALQLGRTLAEDNGLRGIEFQHADVRSELARMRSEGRTFDMVVLDPPKLVPTAKHLERGRRAYRRLNTHAIALTRPGGVLVTCSCSAAMTETEFSRMLALASGDAGRELCVLRVGRQGPDHPIRPGFAEGSYLKTAFAIVR